VNSVTALGGLSLLIGGIGIANVMTIAVLQRASEIGIRRALGHTRAIIASQFLLESALIGAVGGALGLLAGIAFVLVAADYQDWVVELQPAPLLAAALVSILVAVLAGLYPAVRAARMEPLETLRRA
jgi:putative ABC transport system permease protein